MFSQHLPQSLYVKAVLVCLLLIPVLAAILGSSPESAKAASRPGLAYGGDHRPGRERVPAQVAQPAPGGPLLRRLGRVGRPVLQRQEYFGYSSLEPLFSGRISIRRGGRFTKHFVWGDKESDGSFSEDLTLAGRFRGKRAGGRFRVIVTERNPAGAVTNRCDTGQVRWSAVD